MRRITITNNSTGPEDTAFLGFNNGEQQRLAPGESVNLPNPNKTQDFSYFPMVYINESDARDVMDMTMPDDVRIALQRLFRVGATHSPATDHLTG